ncbi:MAG: hypothetical protein ABIY37_06700 [Devosia sp.]
MTLTAPWRKLVLVLHVTSSVGFTGAVAGFLALGIVGLTSTGPLAAAVYPAMQVITWYVIVPLAASSLLIGIIQSLGTPWGLVRYYWVIIKLALTFLALAVLMLQTQSIDMLAQAALQGTLGDYASARFSMVLHGSGGIVVLLTATVLSVYKPRGMTEYGARAIVADRASLT